MSGLAVLLHRDGRPVGEPEIAAMLAAIPDRGPDGMAVGRWDSVGLGHARLAVTPEDEHERQPLVSLRTGCVVIADARLDNRDDLLARLPDRVSRTAGDGELILRAYEAWDLDAPARLLGDFAFAIWDPRRRRLVCARDTSGQRTLFYRADPRTFAAASEIQQLFQDPSVPVAPNEERIRDFLVPLNMLRNEKDSVDTFYEGVSAVPAGSILTVDHADVQVQRYWGMEPPAELRYRRDEEYAEHFRALFSDVVAARLRSAGPIGAMLSGGLDSGSVVCTAQQLYRQGRVGGSGFTSFTLDFGGLDCDEASFVRDIQAEYGFEARFVPPRVLSGRLQLDPSGFQESPTRGVNEKDALLEAASEAGVRVMLTGDVADSCIGGSPLVFDSLLRRGELRALARHLQAYRRMSGQSIRRVLTFYGVVPLLPPALRRRAMAAYIRRDFRLNDWGLLPDWMPESLRTDLYHRYLDLSLESETRRRFASPARQHEYDLLYPPEVARNPIGWPVEIWRPCADRRLHQFLLAVPPEQKYEPHPTAGYYAGSKRLLRQAMAGIVPDSVRLRTAKTMFGALFRQELESRWSAFEAAFGPGGRSELVERGYVDRAGFWARLQGLREGKSGVDRAYLVRMWELETWLRGLTLPRPQLVSVATRRQPVSAGIDSPTATPVATGSPVAGHSRAAHPTRSIPDAAPESGGARLAAICSGRR